jgi:hypothetical protein
MKDHPGRHNRKVGIKAGARRVAARRLWREERTSRPGGSLGARRGREERHSQAIAVADAQGSPNSRSEGARAPALDCWREWLLLSRSCGVDGLRAVASGVLVASAVQAVARWG